MPKYGSERNSLPNTGHKLRPEAERGGRRRHALVGFMDLNYSTLSSLVLIDAR